MCSMHFAIRRQRVSRSVVVSPAQMFCMNSCRLIFIYKCSTPTSNNKQQRRTFQPDHQVIDVNEKQMFDMHSAKRHFVHFHTELATSIDSDAPNISIRKESKAHIYSTRRSDGGASLCALLLFSDEKLEHRQLERATIS